MIASVNQDAERSAPEFPDRRKKKKLPREQNRTQKEKGSTAGHRGFRWELMREFSYPSSAVRYAVTKGHVRWRERRVQPSRCQEPILFPFQPRAHTLKLKPRPQLGTKGRRSESGRSNRSGTWRNALPRSNKSRHSEVSRRRRSKCIWPAR